MAFALLGLDEVNSAAILIVLFVPGYVLLAALFPSDKGLNWIERGALSICLSIAVVTLLGIFINFTSGGIRLVSILSAITLFTLTDEHRASRTA